MVVVCNHKALFHAGENLRVGLTRPKVGASRQDAESRRERLRLFWFAPEDSVLDSLCESLRLCAKLV